MGNSVSPDLGNSVIHGLRDVGLAEPSREVERPTTSQAPDTNRKSQMQFPVPPNSHRVFLCYVFRRYVLQTYYNSTSDFKNCD